MSDNTEARKHHYFSPSTLSRREKCPGSYILESMIDKSKLPVSEAAERGTRIHALAANLISEAFQGHIDASFQREAVENPNEDETQNAAKILEFVRSEAGKWGSNFSMYLERHLSYGDFSGTLYYGFCDLLVVNGKGGWLYDWKTGFRPVESAEENTQGAAYALASMQEYGLDSVCVTFYNPCIGQKTRNTFTNADGIASYIMRVVDACKDENPEYNPGEDQCRYCAAAQTGTCPHYMAEHESAAVVVESQNRMPFTQMPDEAIGELYRRCKLVEKLKESVERELLARIDNAGNCAGWKVTSSRAGREAKDLGALVSVAREANLSEGEILACMKISVSQLEKAFAKALKASGEMPTEAAAKKEFSARTAEYVTEKPPKRCIVYGGNKNA